MDERSLALISAARATRNARSAVVALSESATADELTAGLRAAMEHHDTDAALTLGIAHVLAGGRVPPDVAHRLFVEAEMSAQLIVLMRHVEGDPAQFAIDAIRKGELSSERESLLLYFACEMMVGPASREFIQEMRAFGREASIGPAAGVNFALAARKLDDPEVNAAAKVWAGYGSHLSDAEVARMRRLLLAPVLESLEEVAEGRVIGDGFHTVVRSSPKTGRNDPCPCGSGRKYKKCCEGKEAVSAAPADRVAEFAALDDKPAVQEQLFDLLRPHELARLDPERLTPMQLGQALRKLLSHKRLADAERFVAAFDRQRVPRIMADNWRDELAFAAMEAGDYELAKRVTEAIANPEIREAYAWQFALADAPPAALDVLELEAVKGLMDESKPVLSEVAQAVMARWPALGIVLARGSISPARHLDSYGLLEHAGFARDRAGLPADEPWWDVFDLMFGEDADYDDDGERQDEDYEIAELREELAAANARAAKAARDLEARQKELARLAETPAVPVRDASGVKLEELEEERRRLRAKVEAMKGEIAAGNQQRAELRRQLASVAEDRKQMPPVAPSNARDDEDSVVGEAVTTRPRHVLVPQFSTRAVEAVRSLPSPVGEDAVAMASKLAVGDEGAWSSVKMMRTAHDVLTCRLGRSYRMLFRLAAAHVEVMDVIHRRDLETALRR